jgi:N-acetylglutamate synthase/N-acetylornithine aminotransferase
MSTLGALAGRWDFPLAPELLSLHLGPTRLVHNGVWQGAEAESQAAAVMREKIYGLTINMGMGPYEFWILTNDLGHNYIRINADYRRT